MAQEGDAVTTRSQSQSNCDVSDVVSENQSVVLNSTYRPVGEETDGDTKGNSEENSDNLQETDKENTSNRDQENTDKSRNKNSNSDSSTENKMTQDLKELTEDNSQNGDNVKENKKQVKEQQVGEINANTGKKDDRHLSYSADSPKNDGRNADYAGDTGIVVNTDVDASAKDKGNQEKLANDEKTSNNNEIKSIENNSNDKDVDSKPNDSDANACVAVKDDDNASATYSEDFAPEDEVEETVDSSANGNNSEQEKKICDSNNQTADQDKRDEIKQAALSNKQAEKEAFQKLIDENVHYQKEMEKLQKQLEELQTKQDILVIDLDSEKDKNQEVSEKLKHLEHDLKIYKMKDEKKRFGSQSSMNSTEMREKAKLTDSLQFQTGYLVSKVKEGNETEQYLRQQVSMHGDEKETYEQKIKDLQIRLKRFAKDDEEKNKRVETLENELKEVSVLVHELEEHLDREKLNIIRQNHAAGKTKTSTKEEPTNTVSNNDKQKSKTCTIL